VPLIELGALLELVLDKKIEAVQRGAPVVADDAAAAVRIRQAGDDAGAAALAALGSIRVEDSVVVRLAVFREYLLNVWVGLEAVCLEARLDNAPTALRHDRTLQGARPSANRR
jgi:hypothetical protein